jgi:hypothetical protein
MVTIYEDSKKTNIRNLEKDVKRLYLQPTINGILRPRIAGQPRTVDYDPRDKHTEKRKFRMQHLSMIIEILTLDEPKWRKETKDLINSLPNLS